MGLKELSGLEWVDKIFYLKPRWTIEPDLKSIEQEIAESKALQMLELTKEVQVSFFSQGALNKLYTIQTEDVTFIMRVSLPADFYWKTASEVATVEWMRLNTALPVPQILAHKTNRANRVGFEWILMTKIPGEPLANVWRSMQWQAKEELVQQLAIFSSTLFKKRFRGIGNIYTSSKPCSPYVNDLSRVRRIVSMQFFWGNHIWHDVPRGPFPSSKDWFEARLLLNELESRSILVSSQDEDELEDAFKTLGTIDRLRMHLGDLFPDQSNDWESSILFHDDLSQHNIMTDSYGKLTGVVDWECVTAVPLWKACDYPSFLNGPDRNKKPDENRYEHSDDGIPSSLYFEHLIQYEKTRLRYHFLEEMQSREPAWVEVFKSKSVQRDFDYAVQNCNNEISMNRINKWIDSLTSGKVVSMKDQFWCVVE